MGQQIDYGNVAAGMAIDATGSLINNLNNELQMERTFGFNERAAKNADARTRALFTDLYSPESKEPITDGAPLIYTERKEGVIPAYDVRTDRFEIAVEAMGKVVKSNIAKREQAAAKKAAEAAAAATGTAEAKTTV